MHFFELFIRKVSIYLRSGDVGMTQHHLDRAEISAVLEKVGRKAVPNNVRRDFSRNAGLDRKKFYDSFN